MLRLRRGVVAEARPPAPGTTFAQLAVEIDGERRPAVADQALVGECRDGDEVVVNVEAVELQLGSGGSDIVLVNLTRGLDAPAVSDDHVMKLNYTPLQHSVGPVEGPELVRPASGAVAVFQLHAQLPCIAWAAAQARPELRLGFVQTAGGALPGGMSRTVAELLERGLLCDHITAAPAYGGNAEALSTVGALQAGLADRGWDAAVAGPGPGIIGSASALGHGGMTALDTAHAALALGLATVLAARASSGDRRERHQGISHHTRTVLELLLEPVRIGLAAGAPKPRELARHAVTEYTVDLDGYVGSGLPATTMGRSASEDAMFFEQALAAGMELAAVLAPG